MQTFKMRIWTRVLGFIGGIGLIALCVDMPDIINALSAYITEKYGLVAWIAAPCAYTLYIGITAVLCLQMFKPSRITITPQYIQIPWIQPVFWEDIDQAELRHQGRTLCLFLHIREGKKVQARFLNLFSYKTNTVSVILAELPDYNKFLIAVDSHIPFINT